MEGTGVYWRAPWERLTEAGIRAELFHAQHVKQLKGRKTDIEDSRWLATICQFGLGRPSLVPEREFRAARGLSRHWWTLIQERSRVQKVIDGAGVRIGSILSGRLCCRCPVQNRAGAHEAVTTGPGVGRVVLQTLRLGLAGVAQSPSECHVVFRMLGQGHCPSPASTKVWTTSWACGHRPVDTAPLFVSIDDAAVC